MVNSDQHIVVEGNARIILPEGVFYNRVQEFNRDLTVAVLQWFQRVHQKEFKLKCERRSKLPVENTPSAYGGLRVLEALGASGIRSVRFALEVPNVSTIICNDMDQRAVELISKNIALNNVDKFVKVSALDAVDVMRDHREFPNRFHVVDIDPFGTASPFLDGGIQCIHSGGLLCVTSTDMAVMCGSASGTSMGKYGGMAAKNSALQETGLRILLHAIQSAASKHGMVIEPLLSLSVDFYARVFVRVWNSQLAVRLISSKHAICFTCIGCNAYHIQPLGSLSLSTKRITPSLGPPVNSTCPECGSQFRLWGPIWCGPLHSRPFLHSFLSALGAPVKFPEPEMNSFQAELAFFAPTKYGAVVCDKSKSLYCDSDLSQPIPESSPNATDLTSPILKKRVSERFGTYKRIIGMCTMAYEELEDVLLYHKTDHLAAILGMQVPPLLELFSAFLNAGYRVSSSHAEPSSFKTNAPMSFIWDVYRTYRQRLLETMQSSPDSSVSESLSAIPDDDEIASEPSEKKSKRKRRRLRNRDISPARCEFVSSRNCARSVLLSKPISHTVNFNVHPDANPPSRVDGLVRFQMKPEKFWGPKARPKYMKPTVPIS